MTFVKVKDLPVRRTKHDLRGMIDEFMAENIKTAKVVLNDTDYARSVGCYTSLHCSVKTGGYPIKVRMINGEVYLVRKDL